MNIRTTIAIAALLALAFGTATSAEAGRCKGGARPSFCEPQIDNSRAVRRHRPRVVHSTRARAVYQRPSGIKWCHPLGLSGTWTIAIYSGNPKNRATWRLIDSETRTGRCPYWTRRGPGIFGCVTLPGGAWKGKWLDGSSRN